MKKNNKKTKIFISMLLLISILTVSISPINVSAAGNLAFSVGCDYGTGDIDTTPDALSSCDYYALAGYTSRYTCNPNYTKMRQSYNGTRLLESDIVMLSGHGTQNTVVFDSVQEGGEYVVITRNSLHTAYLIIQNYNMSNVKLFVLDACETAMGTTNIAKTIYDDGALASLGWTTEVGVDCMYQWKLKFNNCIALGYTISGAINYANSFDYGDNSCKNYRLYGNGNQVLKRTSSRSTASTVQSIDDNKSVKLNSLFSKNNINNKVKIEEIIKKAYPNFNFNNFEIEVSADESVITVIEKVGEFYTNNAYVLFYENGEITDVYDRTVGSTSNTIIECCSNPIQETSKEAALTNAIKNINDKYTVVKQKGKAMLDIETGEKYYMVYTTVQIESGEKSVMSYKYAL